MTKCKACVRGPIGGEGHLDLFVLKMSGQEVQFVCRTCSTLWVRKRFTNGDQWWETRSELAAVTIPGPFLAMQRKH